MRKEIFVTVILSLVCLGQAAYVDYQGINWDENFDRKWFNITQGNACAYNGNCTTGYCDQQLGRCISQCGVYEEQGNYTNQCYCTDNNECSSQFCDGHTCKSIEAKDYGFFCNFHSDCGDIGICDHTMHECQPVCRISGCYCTENDQCDSESCKNWHCSNRNLVVSSYVISIIIALSIVLITICLVRIICVRKYIVKVPWATGVIHTANKVVMAGLPDAPPAPLGGGGPPPPGPTPQVSPDFFHQ